jgi:hypothetical protein
MCGVQKIMREIEIDMSWEKKIYIVRREMYIDVE